MKPLYTKKNGTSQRVAAIEVKMPASYPASKLSYESVRVTADGVKTWSTLLDELFALIDSAKVTNNTKFVLEISGTKFLCPLVRRTNEPVFAFSAFVDSNLNGYYSHYYELASTGSKRWLTTLTTSISRTDNSSTVLTSGVILSVIY